MPPIPILILSTLILVWISPLLYEHVMESLRLRSSQLSDMTNDPRKVTAARHNFYWTLSFTLAWCLLALAAYHKHSGLVRGMDLLLGLMWLIATILRYRRWRLMRANVGSCEQPRIISSPGR